MKIGIIVAMGKELSLLQPLLSNTADVEVMGRKFITGAIAQHEVVAMQCGIGKVNAAIGTTLLIEHFAPDVVINTGVAGGADSRVQVMDVVIGSRVAYHDVWCGPESTLGAVQGLPLYYEGSRQLADLIAAGDHTLKGDILSGDQFIDKRATVDEIKRNFPGALAVDMESGAIAQTCHILGTPFLSVRVISDSPGASSDNTRQYQDFWTEAPQHTLEIVKQLITQL